MTQRIEGQFSSGCLRYFEPLTSVVVGHADHKCLSLTTAAAQCGCTYAATAAAQCQGEVQGDPGAGHPQWVSHSDRAAIDIDRVGVDPELSGACQSDGGECLVDLHQIEVGWSESGFGAGGFDGICRLVL